MGGVLAALVVPTSHSRIPAFDIIATDPWPAGYAPEAALLVYNPLAGTPQEVNITASVTGHASSYNVVDATTGKTVAHRLPRADKRVRLSFVIPADWAAVLEFRPAHQKPL